MDERFTVRNPSEDYGPLYAAKLRTVVDNQTGTVWMFSDDTADAIAAKANEDPSYMTPFTEHHPMV